MATTTGRDSAGEPEREPALDLALDLDPALADPLLREAGPLADAAAAPELWEGHLQRWLAELAAELPARLRASEYSLSLSLCSDATIAELNETWRAKAGPTDVLAFAACEDDAAGPPPLPPASETGGEPLELGDIVISLETAARQAGEEGHGLKRELLFLASHGLLHLLGWDHPDEASLAAMLARQERLLGPEPPGAEGAAAAAAGGGR